MRPLDMLDAGELLVAFLLGFITLRLFERWQLAGLRMRARREAAELDHEIASLSRDRKRLILFQSWQSSTIGRAALREQEDDARQHDRATSARELADAAGIGSDRDWLGKKSDAPTIFGDQTDALAPERASDEERP